MKFDLAGFKRILETGITISELARASGLCISTISQIKSGSLKPGRTRIGKIQIGLSKLGVPRGKVKALRVIDELPLERFWKEVGDEQQ